MPLTIHIGIRGSELDTFIAVADRLLPEPLVMHTDDDYWTSDLEVEPQKSDERAQGNDPYHIRIDTMTPMVILNFLVHAMDTFLVPLIDGTKIVVTDESDFRSVYHELTFPDSLN